MGFQKFSADHLFDGFRFRDPDEVLVLSDEGEVAGFIREGDRHPRTGSDPLSGADLQGLPVRHLPGILSPGFINCHCHLELSHLRGLIPRGTGLVDFVGGVMKHRHLGQEEIREGMRVARNEMLAGGIVAVGDICNTDHSLELKKKGGMLFQNFVEVSGFDPQLAAPRFTEALRIRDLFTEAGMPAGIVPHAPYSVSPQLWDKIIYLPGNRVLSIHNQEDQAETDLFLDRTGRFMDLYQAMKLDVSFFRASGTSSLQTYHSNFLPVQRVMLVHNVFTDVADLDYLDGLPVGPELSWCLCPSANLYINNRLPDVELFRKRALSLVFGTDSLASNAQLSILSEMAIIRDEFPGIGLEDLFNWATGNGARALGLEEQVGSFEPGRVPGLINVTTDLRHVERIL